MAARADISTTWYTWFEQGRGGAPSAEVLGRIATALILTDGTKRLTPPCWGRSRSNIPPLLSMAGPLAMIAYNPVDACVTERLTALVNAMTIK